VAVGDISDVLSAATVATVAQWRNAGISDNRMRSLIRSGDLIRVRRGVYATRKGFLLTESDDPRRPHILRAAAVRTAMPRAVVSHQSAAIIHGLNLLNRPDNKNVTVTVPPGAFRGDHGIAGVVRYSANLPDGHVETVAGGKVTTVARTVIDIARNVSFMQGVVVADHALRSRLTSRTKLRLVLQACAGWPGTAKARRVLEFADPRAESVLESCARVFFHEHGLQPPELQVPIYDDEGEFIGRVDFYWSRYKTIAEADGLMKFDDRPRQEVARLLVRDRRLRRTGRNIVHFTWGELFADEGRSVVAEIRANFA
jgi:hypothetical protein